MATNLNANLESDTTFAMIIGDEARALRAKTRANGGVGLSTEERARLRLLLSGAAMVTRTILLRPDVVAVVGISDRLRVLGE